MPTMFRTSHIDGAAKSENIRQICKKVLAMHGVRCYYDVVRISYFSEWVAAHSFL